MGFNELTGNGNFAGGNSLSVLHLQPHAHLTIVVQLGCRGSISPAVNFAANPGAGPTSKSSIEMMRTQAANPLLTPRSALQRNAGLVRASGVDAYNSISPVCRRVAS